MEVNPQTRKKIKLIIDILEGERSLLHNSEQSLTYKECSKIMSARVFLSILHKLQNEDGVLKIVSKNKKPFDISTPVYLTTGKSFTSRDLDIQDTTYNIRLTDKFDAFYRDYLTIDKQREESSPIERTETTKEFCVGEKEIRYKGKTYKLTSGQAKIFSVLHEKYKLDPNTFTKKSKLAKDAGYGGRFKDAFRTNKENLKMFTEEPAGDDTHIRLMIPK